MGFIDDVRALSGVFAKRLDHLDTEEATKHALVLPFIQLLGYDTYNPTEVVPEFTADVGIKKEEKVDYALLQDGRPAILIECKNYGATLNARMLSQLQRYFLTTEARFGILTDGIVYQFFSDLDADNRMDQEPFFAFDILEFTEPQVEVLEQFTKARFNVSKAVNSAREQKYTTRIKRVIAQELENPSGEFLRFIVGRVYEGRATSSVLEQFGHFVKEAFGQFRRELRAEPLEVPAPVEPAVGHPKVPNTDETLWHALSVLQPVRGDARPTGIRFPDGSIRPIRFWKDVLVEVTRWLTRNQLLDGESCPIKRRSRYIVSVEPIHPTGNSFYQPHQVEALFVEGQFTAPGHAENSRVVIEHVEQDPAQFAVRFD